MSAASHDTRGRTLPEILGLAFGAIYLLVGIVGFFITGFDDFAGNEQHEMLLFFMINPLHNIVHILIGVAGLALSRTLAGRAHLRLAARGRLRRRLHLRPPRRRRGLGLPQHQRGGQRACTSRRARRPGHRPDAGPQPRSPTALTTVPTHRRPGPSGRPGSAVFRGVRSTLTTADTVPRNARPDPEGSRWTTIRSCVPWGRARTGRPGPRRAAERPRRRTTARGGLDDPRDGRHRRSPARAGRDLRRRSRCSWCSPPRSGVLVVRRPEGRTRAPERHRIPPDATPVTSAATLPGMDFALSARAEDVTGRMWDFMREQVFPAEPVYEEWRPPAATTTTRTRRCWRSSRPRRASAGCGTSSTTSSPGCPTSSTPRSPRSPAGRR